MMYPEKQTLRKIGLLIVVTAAAGLGVFGVTRIILHNTEFREASTVEGVIVQNTSQEDSGEESEKMETLEDLEMPVESDPMSEALEQYRIMIDQADTYEYIPDSSYEAQGYQYALVQMQPDDPVPSLLLKADCMVENTWNQAWICIFQYDTDTKTVCQSAETIQWGTQTGLAAAGDGYGLLITTWAGGTGEGNVTRIIPDGDTLIRETVWNGQIFEMPDSITSVEIAWHDPEDLSVLDNWKELSGMADSDTLPTDGDRVVLTGTVGTYDYDKIIELQGEPDPNAWDEDSRKFYQDQTFHVIVLDTPRTLRLRTSDSNDYSVHKAVMIDIRETDDMDQYDGQYITFSIDPANTFWPSGTDLPYGQPSTTDIHVLD